MTFALTVLGSSSSLPTSTRFTTAHVLNVHGQFFLIDCGEGTQIQLRKFKIPFSRINHIFISHPHGDHIFGLVGLISSYNLLGRINPLNIYGSADLEKIIKLQLDYFADKLNFEIIFKIISTKKSQRIYEDKHLSVDTIPLKHRIPASGFLFKEKKRLPNIKKECIEKYDIPFKNIPEIKQGDNFTTKNGDKILNKNLIIPSPEPRSYAFCSDTAYFEKIVPIIENIDLLYHETTFMHNMLEHAIETKHSTTIQAATIAKMANVKNLLIGHYSARYKNIDKLLSEASSVFERTFAAEDGLKIEIDVEKKLKIKNNL